MMRAPRSRGVQGRGEVVSVKAMRLVNGAPGFVPFEGKDTTDSEICLIDYAHCPTRDLCWIIDFGSGCDTQDNCIIDTN